MARNKTLPSRNGAHRAATLRASIKALSPQQDVESATQVERIFQMFKRGDDRTAGHVLASLPLAAQVQFWSFFAVSAMREREELRAQVRALTLVKTASSFTQEQRS